MIAHDMVADYQLTICQSLSPRLDVWTKPQACERILTAMPVELPWWQSIPFGTTAWRVSMARRQVVESANSALKDAFADLSRGFFRVMGLVKVTVLLGFTLAAYNLDRIRSFKAKHGLDGHAQVIKMGLTRLNGHVGYVVGSG